MSLSDKEQQKLVSVILVSSTLPQYCRYQDIQAAFLQMKKNYPKEFGKITFDTNAIIPFSKDVDDCLFALGASGVLCWNTYGEYMPVDESIRQAYIKANYIDNAMLHKAAKYIPEFINICKEELLQNK